jgi:hypothetical protein
VNIQIHNTIFSVGVHKNKPLTDVFKIVLTYGPVSLSSVKALPCRSWIILGDAIKLHVYLQQWWQLDTKKTQTKMWHLNVRNEVDTVIIMRDKIREVAKDRWLAESYEMLTECRFLRCNNDKKPVGLLLQLHTKFVKDRCQVAVRNHSSLHPSLSFCAWASFGYWTHLLKKRLNPRMTL